MRVRTCQHCREFTDNYYDQVCISRNLKGIILCRKCHELNVLRQTSASLAKDSLAPGFQRAELMTTKKHKKAGARTGLDRPRAI